MIHAGTLKRASTAKVLYPPIHERTAYVEREDGMTTASNALEGRTALVTGANTGMGKVTAKALAGLGATVLLGCRNLERGEARAPTSLVNR